MDYLSLWKTAVRKNKFISFLDIILKGYGQVIICLNPLTGFLLSGLIFYLSWTVWLLTLLGIISATLFAFLIKARPLEINSGIYGFNGVVLGIAWLWFFKMGAASLILLAIAAAISSLLMKLMIDFNSRSKVNLPVFSLPALILIWLLFILLNYSHYGKGLIGPDQNIIRYLESCQRNFAILAGNFTLAMFFQAFYRLLIASGIIFLGIRVHSRIASLSALISFFLTLALVYFLEGKRGLANIEFYLYNALPASIALGGTFLVSSRKVIAFTLIAVALVVCFTYLGLKYFILPVFVAPFNILTIFFIWLVKANALKREDGFFAVPMEFISTPEFGLEWFKGEKFAFDYWQDIERLAKRQGHG